MSTPSKFTADRRRRILELLGVGASRRAAATAAGIDHATLLRWLRRGEKAAPGGRWAQFYAEVQEAEAHPSLRALERARAREFEDPMAAMRFLERTEPDVWKSEETPSDPTGPIVIRLSFDKPPPVRPRESGDEEPEP